jgi:hypothetical protein
VLDELPEEDIAPDRAQPKGDRIQNQPEDDIFRCYFNLTFSSEKRTSDFSRS